MGRGKGKVEELGANEKLGAGWLVKVHQGMKNKETEGRKNGFI